MSRDEYKGYYDDVYDELYHYGIKGQKWGIRRYQNPDGSLTEEGRRRYGHLGSQEEIDAAIKRDVNRINAEKNIANAYKGADTRSLRRLEQLRKAAEKHPDDEKLQKKLREAEEEQRELDRRIQFSMDRLGSMTVDEIKREKFFKVGSEATLGMIFSPLASGIVALYAKDNPYSFRRDERDWQDYKKNYDWVDPDEAYSGYKYHKNKDAEEKALRWTTQEKWEASKEGQKFFDKMYEQAKTGIPNMTKEQFRNSDIWWNEADNYFDERWVIDSEREKMIKKYT